MPQRTDKIFQDEISEAFGGSNYHNFGLTIQDPRAAIDTAAVASWIAPRAVRIINNRFLARVILGGAQVNTLDIFRNVGGGTDRAVITQFDPDTLVADAVTDQTLSTAEADGFPHVVVDQFGFFVMDVVTGAASTGPFDLAYMAHYSFEDL